MKMTVKPIGTQLAITNQDQHQKKKEERSNCIYGVNDRFQTLQLIRYLLYPDPCQAAISSAICFSLRFPSTICMTSFAVLQVGPI